MARRLIFPDTLLAALVGAWLAFEAGLSPPAVLGLVSGGTILVVAERPA